jgi:hypothetical protein
MCPLTINFLLTEREVFTEKYRTEVFFVMTEPVGQGLYKKTEVRYFSVKTKQARLIKSLLLYGIYTRNKQEMHDLKCILVACMVHIWSKETKITNVFSFLST